MKDNCCCIFKIPLWNTADGYRLTGNRWEHRDRCEGMDWDSLLLTLKRMMGLRTGNYTHLSRRRQDPNTGCSRSSLKSMRSNTVLTCPFARCFDLLANTSETLWQWAEVGDGGGGEAVSSGNLSALVNISAKKHVHFSSFCFGRHLAIRGALKWMSSSWGVFYSETLRHLITTPYSIRSESYAVD